MMATRPTIKTGASSAQARSHVHGEIALVIGVTGHRDIVASEVPGIRERIEALFGDLRREYPDLPLRVMSALAEGADRLVAEVATDLGIELTVVLPMSAEAYRKDFELEESYEELERLRNRADECLELPLVEGQTEASLLASEQARSLQYAQLGVFLCAHSHILLALWDGKDSQQVGSTANVVYCHHHDFMPGYSPPDAIDQQALADDDSDLVYQIVVSRDRADGAPRSDLKPLECFWLTSSDAHPRTSEIPENYRQIFDRTSDFNRDFRIHSERIAHETNPLDEIAPAVSLPSSLRRVIGAFYTADWLAIHFGNKFRRALQYSHVSTFVMAVMILFYEDIAASQLLIFVFAVFLALAFSVHRVAAQGRWHSKYLEYRTLAEGLRVQFYWAVAGVTRRNVTKYAHDNFLQKQDPELGWIRNVMREVGISCDAAPFKDPAGLEFALRRWIGSEQNQGQLNYYLARAEDHSARSKKFDYIGTVWTVLVILLLTGAVLTPSEDQRTILFVALGIVLLTISLRNAYAFRIAEKELIRQYHFMHRIFHNAKNRLEAAPNDLVRRRILHVLGQAALDEHAEWILLHRDRPLSDRSLWKI